MFKKRMKRITPGQMIILSFATMIFIGACLLMLPFSTNDGKGAPFLDALFTSTSASCVTGLIMHDTAQYWSPFGQLIILILIQIGGMGVITMAILLFVLGGKKIGFKQRYFMQQSNFCPKTRRYYPKHKMDYKSYNMCRSTRCHLIRHTLLTAFWTCQRPMVFHIPFHLSLL